MLPVDEVFRGRKEFLVDRLHALLRERPGILDAPVDIGADDAARSVLPPERRILRIEIALRLLLRIQVIEVAEELVEAVIGRKVLVLIAEMVLAELARRVASGLQNIGDGRHPLGDAVRIARHADGQEARAERLLSKDEGGAAGRAALLAIGIGEDRPLRGDAVDVGRAVTYHAHRVGADLRDADIVAEDDEDVRRLAAGAGACATACDCAPMAAAAATSAVDPVRSERRLK